MEVTQQASLFPLEGVPPDRVQPQTLERPTRDGTVHPPLPSVTSAVSGQTLQERLAELGLKPGCAYVYRMGGKLYAWGDFTHCPAEDIAHNIRVLAGWLRESPRLPGIGKSYQADMHRIERTPDWERVRKEVRDIYHEGWRQVQDDGTLAPVEEDDIEPDDHKQTNRR